MWERENKTSAVRHTRALIYEVNGAAWRQKTYQFFDTQNQITMATFRANDARSEPANTRTSKHGKTHVVEADLNF